MKCLSQSGQETPVSVRTLLELNLSANSSSLQVRRDQERELQLLLEANSYGITEGSLLKVWEYLCSEQELR